MMKKGYILSGIFIGVIIFLVGCSSNKSDSSISSTNETTSSTKVLKATTSGLHYPWNYKDDKGKLTGYDVEVTEAIAEKLGYVVKWTTTDFTSQMAQLESGRTDVVAEHVAITDKRKLTYEFTEPYAYPDIELMETSDNNYQSLSDLKGKKVAVALGSFYEDYIRENNPDDEIEVVTYEDTSGIPNDLAYGRVDAYLNDKISGEEKIEQSGLDLKMSGISIFKAQFAYPFSKTDEGIALKNKFDTILKELEKDGTLTKLSDKYFKEDISTLG